jgi:PiT family inorganic phosphate transporter
VLSFAHGANDAQKAMGVIAALLLATGHLGSLYVPLWVKLVCGAALTAGTAVGGWRIVRTVGRRIIRMASIDALATQTASAGVILGASVAGGPVSTTEVVASSVVGVGAGRRRWRHVHWTVVRSIGAAWITTLPAAGAAAALIVLVWEAVS